MLEFAIDGHDGAAKTPVATKVSAKLQSLGYKTIVFESFIEANRRINKNIYPCWQENPQMAMELMESVLKESASSNVDVIIYDRHWMSIIVQLFGTALEKQWTRFIPTFYMQAPIEKTVACERFSWDIPWTHSKEQLEHWITTYDATSKKYAQHILGTYVVSTREQCLKPIENDILKKILHHLSV